MADHLDVHLEDVVLMEEVELISTLMIAATETEGPLDPRQIDRLLGVSDRSATTIVPAQPAGGSST